MSNTFDDARFRELWQKGEEILRLRAKAEAVLQESGFQSFDGLGHLLDRILPADVESMSRLAEALRLSTGNLQRLRAGSLDPLLLPPEALVELGQATSLSIEAFAGLLKRDHARFATRQYEAIARGNDLMASEDAMRAIRNAWQRSQSDSAEGL
jgi:hypothetical protein